VPSISFQSLPAPRPDYDPGLAILTLRCSGAAGGRTAPRAALRLVHGSAELQAALARAAGTEGEAGKERGAEAGETFWSLDLPGTVLQPDVRARVSRVWKLKRQSFNKNLQLCI
jgi:hypothetical protein